MKAINVPEHGHGPVLTFIAPIRDIIIECEFMIPKEPINDRHFRIFIMKTAFADTTFNPPPTLVPNFGR